MLNRRVIIKGYEGIYNVECGESLPNSLSYMNVINTYRTIATKL